MWCSEERPVNPARDRSLQRSPPPTIIRGDEEPPRIVLSPRPAVAARQRNGRESASPARATATEALGCSLSTVRMRGRNVKRCHSYYGGSRWSSVATPAPLFSCAYLTPSSSRAYTHEFVVAVDSPGKRETRFTRFPPLCSLPPSVDPASAKRDKEPRYKPSRILSTTATVCRRLLSIAHAHWMRQWSN